MVKEIPAFGKYQQASQELNQAAFELQQAWEIQRFTQLAAQKAADYLAEKQSRFSDAKVKFENTNSDLTDGGIFIPDPTTAIPGDT